MQSQPIHTIPPPECPGSIAPYQVWAHLSAQQQQQIRQTLIAIIQQSLTRLNMNSTIGEPSDEH